MGIVQLAGGQIACADPAPPGQEADGLVQQSRTLETAVQAGLLSVEETKRLNPSLDSMDWVSQTLSRHKPQFTPAVVVWLMHASNNS